MRVKWLFTVLVVVLVAISLVSSAESFLSPGKYSTLNEEWYLCFSVFSGDPDAQPLAVSICYDAKNQKRVLITESPPLEQDYVSNITVKVDGVPVGWFLSTDAGWAEILFSDSYFNHSIYVSAVGEGSVYAAGMSIKLISWEAEGDNATIKFRRSFSNGYSTVVNNPDTLYIGWLVLNPINDYRLDAWNATVVEETVSDSSDAFRFELYKNDTVAYVEAPYQAVTWDSGFSDDSQTVTAILYLSLNDNYAWPAPGEEDESGGGASAASFALSWDAMLLLIVLIAALIAISILGLWGGLAMAGVLSAGLAAQQLAPSWLPVAFMVALALAAFFRARSSGGEAG